MIHPKSDQWEDEEQPDHRIPPAGENFLGDTQIYISATWQYDVLSLASNAILEKRSWLRDATTRAYKPS